MNEQEQRRFAFVDGSSSGSSLLGLYEAVESALKGFGSALVIVDDLSSLLWSGHSSVDVARFSAGLRALVSKVGLPLFEGWRSLTSMYRVVFKFAGHPAAWR